MFHPLDTIQSLSHTAGNSICHFIPYQTVVSLGRLMLQAVLNVFGIFDFPFIDV